MSYSITPENRVLKDGEDVGYILDGVCYTDNPPKGRAIPAFRLKSKNLNLRFKPLPTGKDSLQVEPPSSAAVIDVGSVMEPAPSSDDAGAGILSVSMRLKDPTIETPAVKEWLDECSRIVNNHLAEPPRSAVLGDRDPEWQRWFVATHGEDAFKAKWPTRKLP